MAERETTREPDRRPGVPVRPPRRDEVDETVEESFPASDVPGWGPLHVGPPGQHGAPDPLPATEPDAADRQRHA